jgi:GT2 family glycosyltransferase
VAGHILVHPGARSDPVNELMATSPLDPTDAGPSVLGFLACAAVMRRDAFLDVGGFEPLLRIGGEEELLAIDLRTAGWTLTYRPDVRVHHAPDVSDSGRAARRATQMRNGAAVAVMRRPGRVVARKIAAITRRAFGDPEARRALSGLLRILPAALSMRRPVDETVERDLTVLARGHPQNHPLG